MTEMLAIRCVEFTTPFDLPSLREALRTLRRMQRTGGSMTCRQPIHEVITREGVVVHTEDTDYPGPGRPVELQLMVDGFGPIFLLPFLVERTPVSGTLVERTQLGMLLRWARDHGVLDQAHALVKARRRARRVEMTLTQRRWMLQSRRPARGRHHDSWSIRERYVRITGGGEPEWSA